MDKLDNVVVIGGGLAGANAAFALRDEGYEGRLTIVSDDPEWPYERPAMSKQYLRGEDPLEKSYVRPIADYETNAVELLRSSAATEIDVRARVVRTAGGDVPWNALVVATGAEPRRLAVANGEAPGIHYLRNAADADALRSASEAANDIVVAGGGWIGSEVAASLRQLGRPVTFLTSRPRPLEHVLGTEVADVYRQAHVEHGVRFAQGRVERVHVDGAGRVAALETADGTRLVADLVVIGVGAVPRIALAEQAGLLTDHGAIRVDQYLRTSVPTIYAIGDVASAWNPRYGRRVHVEHWDNAIQQGRTAALNILGRDTVYDRVPYLYSDQYDVGMEYRGFAPDWDEVVIRGDLGRREFHAFWLQRGRIAAAMNVNLWDDGDALQELVASSVVADTDRLSDAEVPLLQAA
jgi:3-phenylpropionate/trans-cinnamate dioxygenase ferredoxin reductase subunit